MNVFAEQLPVENKLKPLYASLKRLRIGDYLHSREFQLFTIEYNIDDLWTRCYNQIEKRIFAAGYTEYEEQAFLVFLSALYFRSQTTPNRKVFITYTLTILTKFAEWSPTKIDFKTSIEHLKKLNVPPPPLSLFIKNTNFIAKNKSVNSSEKGTAIKPELTTKNETDIFVVHGHNETLKTLVYNTLLKLKLTPIILHEKPNSGQTIIEKFEKYSNVGFAVILLTDDDTGQSNLEKISRKRARQNVILELGYFIGKLGRKNVLPLYVKDVELPSDIHGLSYIPADSVSEWQHLLVRELKDAGYKIDANNLF